MVSFSTISLYSDVYKSQIINKKAIAASHIYQIMLDDNVMNMRFLTTANADVAEFVAKEKSRVTKKPVKDLGLPKGTTIGGLVRNDEGMLVSGHTQILAGDIVVVFCHNVNMKTIEKFFICLLYTSNCLHQDNIACDRTVSQRRKSYTFYVHLLSWRLPTLQSRSWGDLDISSYVHRRCVYHTLLRKFDDKVFEGRSSA